jgi:nucleotide-binding universal stress UspA family protein
MHNAILVPLDGSPLAERAVPIATRLAQAANSALHLVHVHTPGNPNPISIEGMPVVDDQLRSLAEDHERAYLAQVASRVEGEGLTPVTARLAGSVLQALTAYGREHGASLIVMTTHGRSGFARTWLGSTAESLVRASGTPMLLLRPTASGELPGGPFRRTLVPLDGSTLAEAILPHAVALAQIEGGQLQLLRVVDTLPVPGTMPFREQFRREQSAVAKERDEAESYLASVAAGLSGVRVQHQVVEADDPGDAVVAAARASAADLVALTTHGKGAAPRTALGRIADKLLRAECGALLVLRPPL